MVPGEYRLREQEISQQEESLRLEKLKIEVEAKRVDMTHNREVAADNEKGLDRLILIVSTGVFAISITFVTGLASGGLTNPGYLIGAWIMFALAILLQTAGYILGIHSAD